MRSCSLLALGTSMVALSGCEDSPVVWDPSLQRISSAIVASAGPRWMLTSGRQAGELVQAPPDAGAPPAGSCRGSLVASRTSGAEWFRAWWAARDDSSVALVVAGSSDGGLRWSPGVIADARDQGRRGCDRPPPAIAGDSVSGYVHLAYFLEPMEGSGVWLIHSMEHGRMWHSPVPIAFGGDPASVAVAAEADVVAVAYESPNAREAWIGLALSTSDGHLIDWRIPEVSGRSVPVRSPRVAIDGRRLTVAWQTQRGSLTMCRTGLRR